MTDVEMGTPHIAPEAPRENGNAESFDSRLRGEFLATEVFEPAGGPGPDSGVRAGMCYFRSAYDLTPAHTPTLVEPS